MNVQKFRKNPIVVEAHIYTRNGEEAEEVAFWCNGDQTDDGLVVHTRVGDMLAEYNDWIIKGVNGEFYPCKPHIFQKTYKAI